MTLTGPGGVGKSRLAIAVATPLVPVFDDGVAFVPLATIVDAPGILPAIRRSLGVADPGDDSVLDRLVISLRDRKALLVLDNTEQIPDASPVIATHGGDPGLNFRHEVHLAG